MPPINGFGGLQLLHDHKAGGADKDCSSGEWVSRQCNHKYLKQYGSEIECVTVGGESEEGPGIRPMNFGWVIETQMQCHVYTDPDECGKHSKRKAISSARRFLEELIDLVYNGIAFLTTVGFVGIEWMNSFRAKN